MSLMIFESIFFVLIHSHSGHSHSAGWHLWSFWFVFFWCIDDECFSRQKHTSDRNCILESGSLDFFWIDDSRSDEVFVLVRGSIISEIIICIFEDFVDHDSSFFSSIFGDLSYWVRECASDDVGSDFF